MTEKSAKFYEITLPERVESLIQTAGLTPGQASALESAGGLSLAQADAMIENVAGLYSLPLGVAQNFRVNGRDVLVPMVVEEPSIVAGASFMAKLIRAGGGFTAETDEPIMIGQMQVLDIIDLEAAEEAILENRDELLAQAASFDPMLVKVGGGPRDLQVRIIPESPIGPFMVLHWLVDVRDAMGANAVNTIVERMSPEIERPHQRTRASAHSLEPGRPPSGARPLHRSTGCTGLRRVLRRAGS